MQNRCKIRVLLLTNAMTVGGSQRYLSLLLTHLDRARFAPELALLSNAPIEYDIPRDVPVHVVEARAPALVFPPEVAALFVDDAAWVPTVVETIVDLVGRLQPDIVLATPEHTAVLAAIASNGFPALTQLAVRIPALPSAAFSLGTGLDAYAMLARRFLKCADLVHVNSQTIASELVSKFDVDSDVVTVLPNPLDLNMVSLLATEPVTDVSLGDGVPSVVFVGRLAPIKGLDYLLRAIAHASARMHVRCVLVGEGPQRGYLLALSKHLGIADRVVFVGRQANPFKYMSKADVFVLPSLSEGMPNVLLEAMASGCSVIATDIEGGMTRRLLEDGRCGRIVPPGDATRLAEAIVQVLTDERLSETLRESGTLRVQEFDVPVVMRRNEERLVSLHDAAGERSSRYRFDLSPRTSMEGAESGRDSSGRMSRLRLAYPALRARAAGLLKRGRGQSASASLARARQEADQRVAGAMHVTIVVPTVGDGLAGTGLPAVLAGIDRGLLEVSLVRLYSLAEDVKVPLEQYVVKPIPGESHSVTQRMSTAAAARHKSSVDTLAAEARGLSHLLKELRTDAVLAEGFHASVVALLARDEGLRNVAVIAKMHNSAAEVSTASSAPEVYTSLIPSCFAEADLVLADTEAIASDLTEAYGVKQSSVRVLPDPVPLEPVAQVSRPDSSKADVIFGLGADRADARLALDALTVVLAQEQVRCVLACASHQVEGVRRLVDESGMSQLVEVSSEPAMAHTPAPKIYADLSRHRGYGVSPEVVEAINQCVAVIVVGPSDATRHFLRDGALALLAPTGDARSLSDAILQHLWDDENRRKMIADAAEHLRSVSAAQVVPRLERLVLETVRRKRRESSHR